MAVIPCSTAAATSGNYTLGTFTLELRQMTGYDHFIKTWSGGYGNAGKPTWTVGNIQTAGFTYTPTTLEHRRGTDNSLDGIFVMGKDYGLTFTGDEITGYNLAMVLSESTVIWQYADLTADLYIPLRGAKLFNEYAVKMTHTFPDQETALVIEFWRAEVMQEFSLDMTRDNFAAFQGSIKSLYCETRPDWPTPPGTPIGGTFGPYGRIYMTKVTSQVQDFGPGDVGWYDITE